MSYDRKTGLYTGYIYKIECDINHKLYVGQTRSTLKHRWSTYISDVKNNKQGCGDIIRAMQDLGINHFHQSELCSKSFPTLDELLSWMEKQEKYYIELYDLNNPEKGYNIETGGLEGFIKTTGHEYVQYDLNGKYIATYRHSTLPKEYDRISVLGVCLGDKYTAYGYIWRFSNDPFNKYPLPTELTKKRSEGRQINQNMKVIQYNLSGEIINVYSNPIEAAKKFCTKPQVIKNACTGVCHTFKNSIFRFEGDAFDKYDDIKDIKIFNGQNWGTRVHDIYMYNQYGELVKYDLLNHIAKEYHIGHGAIENRLKNGEPLINGEKAYLFSSVPLSPEEVQLKFNDKYRVFVYNKDGTLFGKYFSYIMAAKNTDVSSTSLQYYFQGKTTLSKSKYKFYDHLLENQLHK